MKFQRYAILLCTIALTVGAGSSQAADGEEIYTGAMPPCSSCHNTGAAGAPKVGDADSWGDRLDADTAELVQNVKDGQGAMPAYKDRNSEEELTAAVEWMVEQTRNAE